MKQTEFEYDAFISHAVEDKIPIANELFNRLVAANLKVWYSGIELNPGDHISQTIEEGLRKSRFGIIIFTRNYIQKAYALRELHLLRDIEKAGQLSGRKVILPVLHDITPPEIAAKGLEMEDRFQISTEKGMDYVVKRLVAEIRKPPVKNTSTTRLKWMIAVLIGLIMVSFVSLGIYQQWSTRDADLEETLITTTINEHIQNIDNLVSQDYNLAMASGTGKVVDAKTIEELYTYYRTFKSHYRNAYELNTGGKIVVSKKNVDAALSVDMETLTPFNSYTLSSSVITLIYDKTTDEGRSIQYCYTNSQSVQYNYTKEKLNDFSYRITVTYTNAPRYFKADLSLPLTPAGIKRHHLYILALPPQEQFEFEKMEGTWRLREIE